MKSLAVVTLAALLALASAVHAATDEEKCRDTILKETGKYLKAQVKTLTKCNDSVVKGRGGFNNVQGAGCRDTAGIAQLKLDKATSKFLAGIDKRCGGDDKQCGTQDDLDIDDPAIGWGGSGSFGNGFVGVCPDFESSGCRNFIRHCGGTDSDGEGVTDCVLCIQDKVIDQTMDFLFADLDDSKFGAGSDPDETINECQQALVKVSAKHVLAKSQTLSKCWQAVNKGKTGFSSSDAAGCIDSSGKTAVKIDKSESKKIAGICKMCGGNDNACDQIITTIAGTSVRGAQGEGVGGDLDPLADIGFGTACPNVTLPYATNTNCGGLDNLPSGSTDDVIENMEEFVKCLDCVLEFKVDCADRSVVPNHEALPVECNACVAETDGDPCPTTLQVTADGFATRLDVGWTGLSHDLDVPSNGRLTLNVSNCDGTERPTCGECDLDGPIENAGGPKFDNHRCAAANWITCSTDSDCGANGPCVLYFGVGLPLSSGGVPICVTNEVVAPITGTVDLDTGETASTVNLISRVHVGLQNEQPCPTCEFNSNESEFQCIGGLRSGEACLVNSKSSIFGDLSYDCPPSGVIGTLRITLTPTTGVQTRKLSAESPNCRAVGFTTAKCFCDSCDNAEATPCFNDADCGAVGATTCGGLRCLGGINNGDPCTAPSDCGGSPCSVPGQPTQPNQCLSAMCTPNPGDPDSADEGVCATGPFDALCSIERFRGCNTSADCNPPPAGTCTTCLSGQSCVSFPRQCYTDDGVICDSVFAEGTPDPSCGNIAEPTLATLFCIPPTQAASVDATRGLPGLGRLGLPVEAVYGP